MLDNLFVSSHAAYVHNAQTLGKCQMHRLRDYAEEMDTPAARLKKAREEAGFSSAREAAMAMGIAYETYAQHENGTRGLPAKRAEVYGRRFRVAPEWLLYGKHQPEPATEVIMAPVQMPNAERLTVMMAGLLDSVGLAHLEDEYAEQLAELFPAALSTALSPQGHVAENAHPMPTAQRHKRSATDPGRQS